MQRGRGIPQVNAEFKFPRVSARCTIYRNYKILGHFRADFTRAEFTQSEGETQEEKDKRIPMRAV